MRVNVAHTILLLLLTGPWASLPAEAQSGSTALLPCNASDEEENVRRAYSFAKARRFYEALPCLQRAAHHFTYIPAIHKDLGRAALRVARRMLREQDQPADVCAAVTDQNGPLALLVDACASLSLAKVLGDPAVAEPLSRCHEALAQQADCTSSGSDGWKNRSLDAASTLLDFRERRRHGRATSEVVADFARKVCSAESLAVPVSDDEVQTGYLRPVTTLDVFLRLEVCGLVELRGSIIPAEVLSAIAAKQEQELLSGPLDGASAVERWQKRIEKQVPLAEPYTQSSLVASPAVLHLVRLALGPRVEIDTFSQVTALAGAPTQPWHSDVDLLFKEPGALEANHLPAAGLVAIVPLLDLTEELGPTEFLAGSHHYLGDSVWDNVANETASPPIVRPVTKKGSVVLLDLRVRHHGTANNAKVSRSILYLSYVKDWFLDRLNFRGRQSRAFDGLGSLTLKKLLRRVDARSYLDDLQAFAAGSSDVPPKAAEPFREPDLSI